MLKAVIFDMDGVLIDTVTIGLQTRKKILTDRYNIDLDSVPDSMGLGHRIASMPTLLANIEKHTGLHIDPREFTELEVDSLREELPRLVTVDVGLVALLDELQAHKIICAIATTGQRELADTKLDVLGIRPYFSVIVTGNDVTSHKPDPAAYLYTMKQLGVTPDECIIFEDSLPGVQAGLAAGCKVVGFTQYNPPKMLLPGVVAAIARWSDITYGKLEQILAAAS